MVVEEASPISSRPPAPSGLDEILPLSGGDMDALAAAADVGPSSGGGGGGGGNRWPRQETLALLRIRSEMDAAFRDATLKGPLWEDVSRKLGELGYRRSAKKCKEKFENVHKYYKRTKEGRAGRQDGKTYKFFSELEALHNTAATTVGMSPAPGGGAAAVAAAPGGLSVPPVSIGISFANPVPISSLRVQPPVLAPHPPHTHHIFAPTTAPGLAAPPAVSASPMGLIFSSNSSSSSGRSEDEDDDEEDEEEGEPSTTGSSRKRKRGPGETSGSGSGNHRRMMELFEGLMKQVMQKQEEMQKRFLEAIEKREQDRMIREEAWRRQEMARLAREHEIAAQERAASASRDAAIVSFLQKITGQTIHLPTTPATVTTSVPLPSPTPPPKPQVQPTHAAPHPQPPMPPPPTYQEQPQQQQRQSIRVVTHPLPASTEIIMAVPEQQVPPQSQELILSGGSGGEPSSSSRWPKVEVLALIKLRSGLESRYQEAGPKGQLWEEISAGMARMGYKRSAKRCKEKWENINKYFKKVKESDKKRPEDAKTCPYFHELDALYRRKVLGSGGATSGAAATSGSAGFRAELSPSTANLDARPVIAQDPPPPSPPPAQAQASEPERKDGGGNSGAQERIVEEGNGGSLKKPEDTVKELIGQGQHQNQHLDSEQQHLTVNSSNYSDKMEDAGDSDNIEDQEENELEEDDEENDEDEELEEERKMAYKIEFQRPNATAPPNGGGSGAPSFLAMVQ
ncbi:hypothetical protein NL676_011030 [Syzygium grande]|nr:hypothetical protein NL676_011030 [Syzygium grande]